MATGKRMNKKKQRSDPEETYDNLFDNRRYVDNEENTNINDGRGEEERTTSSLSNGNGRIRSSAGSMRTRTSDYDSGFGTHNTTKLSRDR